MREVVIELTTPEEYPINPDSFPVISHVRVVNFTYEIDRVAENKDGYVDVWVAKGYLGGPDVTFFEAPGLEGINYKIEGDELPDIVANITSIEDFEVEVFKIISQFLIDNGHIDGNVEVLNQGE